MANTSAIWQQAAHTTYQLSSPSCSTRAIQKSLTLNEKYLRVFWEKSQENEPLVEKWQDRKSKRTRQKKTREEIGKGNQMTALRFQTGGWHQTSRPPSGVRERERERERERGRVINVQDNKDTYMRSPIKRHQYFSELTNHQAEVYINLQKLIQFLWPVSKRIPHVWADTLCTFWWCCLHCTRSKSIRRHQTVNIITWVT